jgi:hypothetical protein
MRATSILCGLCFLSLSAAGQLRLGGTFGGQISNFVANDNGKARGGWSAGILATYDLERPFKFSTELGTTVDRSSFDFPMLPLRQRQWEYVWLDATMIGAFRPVIRKDFSVVLGSGLSVRRILQSGLKYSEPSSSSAVFGQVLSWSYFLPVQAGVDFNFGGGNRLSLMLEYQVQLRQLYKPGSKTFYYSGFENMEEPRLHSLSLNMAYFCFDMPGKRRL